MQMPDNWQEPSHTLMRQVASEMGLPDRGRQPLLPPAARYDLLSRRGCEVDIWRTTYFHPLASHQAIVDWLQGTGLRPIWRARTSRPEARFSHAISHCWQHTIRYSVTGRCSCVSTAVYRGAKDRRLTVGIGGQKSGVMKGVKDRLYHPDFQD